MLLPCQRPGAGRERARGQHPGLRVAVLVVVGVDSEPVALALGGIALVVGPEPSAVEAQEVREAVPSGHGRYRGRIVESYPIATTVTNCPARAEGASGAPVCAGAPGPPDPETDRGQHDRREQHVLPAAGE